MRNKMNGKIYCLGVLFSLSLGSGLAAEVLSEIEKSKGEPAQNVAQSGKTAVAVNVPISTATTNEPKAQNASLWAAFEFSNIQKIFEYKEILSVFNVNNYAVNLLVLSMIPQVGKNFSAVEENSKVSVLFMKTSRELSPVFVLKPAADEKKTFLATCQSEKFPFFEENNYLFLLPSKDEDCLSAIKSNKDLLKQATTSIAKKEDPFKVECIFNIDEVVSKGLKKMNNEIACLLAFKDLKITMEFVPEGIKLSGALSFDPAFPFYTQLAKANYTKPFLPLGCELKESILSYLVSRDVSWMWDILGFCVRSSSRFDKQFLDGLLNIINDFKRSVGSMQFGGLVQYRNDLVNFEVKETPCKTIEEYVNCLNSIFNLNETISPESKAVPSVTDQGSNVVPAPSGSVDQKSKVDGQKKLINVKLLCEYKGNQIYVKKYDEEISKEIFQETGIQVEMENWVDYLVMWDNLLLSSSSLDYLKSKIDVLGAEKAPEMTIETLVDGCPPGMIAKGKLKIVSYIRVLNAKIPSLKKYFTDALLAQIGNNEEIIFEVTAQEAGLVTFQLFVNNDFLKAISVLIKILNNIFVDFGLRQNEVYKGMVPAKTDEAKNQNFIPVKKDDAKGNPSLIPAKVVYDWNDDVCYEERQILIPVKILTEYKAMG
ncbi:MAG: hypothetical protein LBQ03_00565 [Puniceicoccales bacterium]|nr:hypothetical protein [Puniceicoccales bacterium]